METKKYGPNKRTEKNTRKGAKHKEIANISDGEFKTLVIKMLAELTKLGCKMKEQMKGTQSEIKQIIQGSNSDRK